MGDGERVAGAVRVALALPVGLRVADALGVPVRVPEALPVSERVLDELPVLEHAPLRETVVEADGVDVGSAV